MDIRIKEIIDTTKNRFGLDNYYLRNYSLHREVTIHSKTVYTMSMEWFPNHVTEQEEDGTNPEGTAVIEIGVENQQIISIIFVGGQTFAIGNSFVNYNRNDIINWIERETGLTYRNQFQLHKAEEGELQFRECIEGVDVSPSGFIEFKINEEGKLTLFSVHGHFPSKDMVKKAEYTLSLDIIESLSRQQLKLIEIPSFEQQKLVPVYVLEEIFITNDQMFTIPVEILSDVREYQQLDQVLLWERSIDTYFDRKEINWFEEVSVDQVFSREPSPDSMPITKAIQQQVVQAVKKMLQQEYPSDSGNWKLETIHREHGYIHAILRTTKEKQRVFRRKLVVMIDPNNFQAVNYMDNKPMLEMFENFLGYEKLTVTKEQAYEKLKGFFELKPYYVYDFKLSQYVLCGRLDCQYGVNALNGEVIELNDL
ncbi:hypothetical protein GMD78_18350 [Ornithinibacillus sp. L9]|uniref:DUF4901 domain-containing protein n=1 Tax=Ornithinibacillus caprae TaxID=2678566 RepID=A0A6N8FRD6_9BACI|nr:hypothetical protein [Ornithinibacillus caprae]MUK90338.1 hypothetical protein [Ornithinibacillus caprae]